MKVWLVMEVHKTRLLPKHIVGIFNDEKKASEASFQRAITVGEVTALNEASQR